MAVYDCKLFNLPKIRLRFRTHLLLNFKKKVSLYHVRKKNKMLQKNNLPRDQLPLKSINHVEFKLRSHERHVLVIVFLIQSDVKSYCQ